MLWTKDILGSFDVCSFSSLPLSISALSVVMLVYANMYKYMQMLITLQINNPLVFASWILTSLPDSLQ